MGWRLGALLCFSTLAQAALFPNKMSWKQAVIPVYFQSALSQELESPNPNLPGHPSLGHAKDRERVMDLVLREWNSALTAIGSTARLKLLTSTKAFAAEQGAPVCQDAESLDFVYQSDDSRWSGDGKTLGSTAQNSASHHKNLGPGWVVGGTLTSESIDGRLAQAALLPLPRDLSQSRIREADLLWFTHLQQGKRCSRLRWNYLVANIPAPAPYYDFFSVMLHEVGHLLGLDHEACPAGGRAPRNVMQPTLNPGERLVVSACELSALRALYGPSASGNVPVRPRD